MWCQLPFLNDKKGKKSNALGPLLLLELFIEAQNENRRHHLGDEESWN